MAQVDQTVTGNLTVNGTATVAGNATLNGSLTLLGLQRITGSGTFPNLQGAYVGWNRSSSLGETSFVTHKGGGVGGFTFDNTANGSSFTNLVTITGGGNVGIGQTAPTFKFELAGAAGTSGVARIGNIDYGTVKVLSVAPGTVQFDAPNVAGGRMTILGSNGNVGIGSTAPTAKLDVAGSIHVASGSPTAMIPGIFGPKHAGIGFAVAANYETTVAYGYTYGTALGANPLFQVAARPYDADPLAVWDPSQHTFFTVDGLGNVGIGTPSPSVKLEVNGDGKFGHVTSESSGGQSAYFGHQVGAGFASGNNAVFQGVTDNTTAGAANWLVRGYRGTTFKWGADFDGVLTWQDTNLYRNAAGSLKTDGAFSATSLTVTGATTFSGTLSVANLTASSGAITGSATSGLSLTAGAANKDITLAPTGTGNIVLAPASTGNTLIPSGNVGVGVVTSTYMTSSNGTQYKLSVEGKIHAKEVVVDSDAASWSDYVFADNYRNAPLAEVEQHIKEHGHLPGIPSANEVEQKGVNLGQMQALLLAKVEELTLHLIEQEKQMTEQGKRLQRLEQENAALRADR